MTHRGYSAQAFEELEAQPPKQGGGALQRLMAMVPGVPALDDAEMFELWELLTEYAQAKFGDEWWPGNAQEWIGQEKAERLWALTDRLHGKSPETGSAERGGNRA
jgi:hypothetical protein